MTKKEPRSSSPPPLSAAHPSPQETNPLGVLVVEDDQDLRQIVTLMAGSMGYTVYTAATGKEGLDLLHRDAIDIILLDIMMPEMDGFEFCRAVQADERFQDMHIIITSARDALEDKVKGLELGAADYLTKPFSLTELRARIKVGERIVRSQKELKAQQALLEQLAREDELTGLCNRRHFEERAQEECLRAYRYRHPLSLLLGDIDLFKQVNDRYGHACGDLVLKQVGQTLVYNCRSSDLTARYGGEEFAVLLPETGLEAAQRVAERLCSAVRTLTFVYDSQPFHVTISIGLISQNREQPQTLAELLEKADQALYTAKRKGRNRVETWGQDESAGQAPSRKSG